MHFIITDAWLAKSRAVHLSGTKLVVALMGLSLALMLSAAGLYHWVFLKGAREGWPVIGALVKLVVKDEFEQRDRFMRENLDAMARKLGEMQAKLIQLDALGERVSGLAGVVWRNSSPAGPVNLPTCRRCSSARARGQVVAWSGVLAWVSTIRASSSASQQSRTWARMRSSRRW